MKKDIKFLITDVDGSLTDGKIYMGNDGESMKAFSIKDGYAVNFILKPAGIETIVITGRNSKIVENRCHELGIKKMYQGRTEKFPILCEVTRDELDSVAYFGDDVLDLACMLPVKQAGGVVGCPADAVRDVKAASDYICINKAGEGAFREFAEWLVNERPEVNGIEKRISEAVKYIERMEKSQISVGTYVVDDYFYYSVQEYDTKPEEECKLESHRTHIDIQWIVEGEEMLAFSDISNLVMESEYDKHMDVILWKQKNYISRVLLKPNSYIILYPQSAHMGCINTNKKHHVLKIVGKVMI